MGAAAHCQEPSFGDAGMSQGPVEATPVHNGASNEIKEIEVCKKCPKVKPYCGPIFDPIMFKLFWMMQN